ncbi:MAG: Fur family ferric uptake transcriptional regulator [Planctomycetota bacterium]
MTVAFEGKVAWLQLRIDYHFSPMSYKQEQVLDELLQSPGPMAANELWERMRANHSGIGLATVYRALNRGVDEGRLVAVGLEPGAVRYEAANLAHHHHFLCSSCDRAFDLKGCVRSIERLLPEGFEMTNHEILLYGLCADCRNAS